MYCQTVKLEKSTGQKGEHGGEDADDENGNKRPGDENTAKPRVIHLRWGASAPSVPWPKLVMEEDPVTGAIRIVLKY